MSKAKTVAVKESQNTVGSFTEEFAPVDVSKLVLKERVVMPTLSTKGVKEGDTLIVRLLSEPISAPQNKENGEPDIDDKGRQKMIHTVNAVNVQTGEYGNMVLGIVVANGMESVKARTGDLTGRMFALRKIKANTGKATQWEVVEVHQA